MAFAGGGLNRLSTRDPAPGPRFFLFAVLSIVLMYYDQRDGWSAQIRYGLQAAVYPLQVAVGSPRKLWNATTGFFESRDAPQGRGLPATGRTQNDAEGPGLDLQINAIQRTRLTERLGGKAFHLGSGSQGKHV